jgi:hypothetical protein
MIVEAVVYGLDLTNRLGLELWRRTVRDLDQLGLLARSDGAVVLAHAATCEQLERAVADNPPDRARLAERRAARTLTWVPDGAGRVAPRAPARRGARAVARRE